MLKGSCVSEASKPSLLSTRRTLQDNPPACSQLRTSPRRPDGIPKWSVRTGRVFVSEFSEGREGPHSQRCRADSQGHFVDDSPERAHMLTTSTKS
jgi:hypothetical protein